MRHRKQSTHRAAVTPGSAVRLARPHAVAGGIELAAGSTGRVVESYDSDLGTRYVLHFGDIETVVFAHEIYPADDTEDPPGDRTDLW